MDGALLLFLYIEITWGLSIKVNLEFIFSFFGVSFSGLDPNVYSGFKPEIHFTLTLRH